LVHAETRLGTDLLDLGGAAVLVDQDADRDRRLLLHAAGDRRVGEGGLAGPPRRAPPGAGRPRPSAAPFRRPGRRRRRRGGGGGRGGGGWRVTRGGTTPGPGVTSSPTRTCGAAAGVVAAAVGVGAGAAGWLAGWLAGCVAGCVAGGVAAAGWLVDGGGVGVA